MRYAISLLLQAITSAMLLAIWSGPAFAASNPNLNGCWQLYRSTGAYNDSWQITSGTSTNIAGLSETSVFGTPCGGVYGHLSGSISNGSGNVLESDDTYGWAYVITSASSSTMTGYSYYEFGGVYGSPPAAPSYSECVAEQQANQGNPYSGWDCEEITWRNLSAPAESLSVSVSPKVPPGGLSVGSSLSVPVTVSASGGPVSGVSLGALKVGSGGSVKVTSTPAGTSGFSLAAGQSRTFSYSVAGVKAGTAVLGITASGRGADGSALTKSASTSFPVVQKALKITMAADPGKVSLEADNDGKLAPKEIKVRVRLANTSKARLTGVKLLSLDPAPADPTQQLDKLAFARGALPINFGTIEPGASKVKTLTLKVTGDGTYVINALALYNDPSRPGGNGRAVGQGGKFTVSIPLLYFKASKDVPSVDAGGSWYVTGHVRDLSSFQTLCLSPLAPGWKDNAGGSPPHQIEVVPVDKPAPALAGTVKPGQTISFLMRVRTLVGGTQTSAVTLDPHASKGDPGDACLVVDADKRPGLSAKEIKLAKDSTSFRVRVTPAPPSVGGSGPLEFFGGYAEGSATLIAQLFESGSSLVKEYGSPAALISALGSGASKVLSRLYHAAAFSAWFWYVATPEERLQFEAQVADDFVHTAGKVWDGVQAEVEQAVARYMKLLESAYLTGDWSALFHALGESSSKVINEQAITVGAWELGLELLQRTGVVGKTILRAREEIQSQALTSLKAVPVGRLLNFTEMQRLWGLAHEDYVAFKRIAEEEQVLIGVRGRSPATVKNLEEGAVWKHENLKPKNVNSIDTKYLGFDEQDKGLVAFRSYTPEEQATIRKSIADAKLTKAQRDAVESRLKTRFAEAPEYLQDIEGYSQKGQIDIKFNYADNGITRESPSNVRAFTLKPEPVQGGTYYRPYQENPALDGLADGTGDLPGDAGKCIRDTIKAIKKLLCRVTGDMDGVYLTGLDSTGLSEAKRIAVYAKLAAVGWQHPETLTWIKKGLFDFASKTKILQGLELGGEAMMEFAPGGIVRATYLNLAQSKLASVNNYFVAVLGGLTELKNNLPGVP